MQFIDIEKTLRRIAKTERGRKTLKRIQRAHIILVNKLPTDRSDYLKQNGSNKWSPLKTEFTQLLGNKCWYTEVEITGAPLTIDHFRPQCFYWFLALDPTNYRVSCPFANSPKDNPLYGCAGGKHDEFPLLGKIERARGKSGLKREKPLLLDPCSASDCDLLVFQEDGRPKLNPNFSTDPIALERVERSLLLLNIDHPDFNSKREQLYYDIHDDVDDYEKLAEGDSSRVRIRKRMERRIDPKAPFSTAARHYLKRFRYLDWVEALLM